MHDICNSYLVPINLKDYNECAWRLCGIYKITNKISGKCYIGQAVDIRKRLQQHVASYIRKSTLKIYKAINKYGIDNFQVEVLIILNIFGKNKSEIKKELNAQECFYIQLYDSYKISGRFISKRRYLFSFSKEELLDRIDWFNSQEYINKKKHRKRGRL